MYQVRLAIFDVSDTGIIRSETGSHTDDLVQEVYQMQFPSLGRVLAEFGWWKELQKCWFPSMS